MTSSSLAHPLVLAFALAGAAASCGGTNSETPWPVEPEDVDLGPEGEARGQAELGAPASSAPKATPPSNPGRVPVKPSLPAPAKEPTPQPGSMPSNPSTQF